MLQFSTDISALSVAQREAVAAFILSFPVDQDEPIIPSAPFSLPATEDVDDSPESVFSAPAPAANPTSVLPQIPAPVATQTGVSVDAKGLPWDDRIHSSNRALVADGTWRKKRGVDDALFAQVEGELKALMGIPSPAPVPPPPAVPVPPPPAVPVDKNLFISLVQLATDVLGSQKITQAQFDECITREGVPSFAMLANRLDLVPQVIANVKALAGVA